jgi:hypothetical protein
MSETICNPQTLMFNGAPVSDANPLPCNSTADTGALVSTAVLGPVTWLINGELVSDTNPIPITLP